ISGAKDSLSKVTRYPIKLTRDLGKAKQWLRHQARGSERFGLLVSSAAERLRPLAVNVRSPVNPVHWFLEGKEDVRSSYYLEDVGTEFLVQGLELDWACVTWDADLRHSAIGWQHWSFSGSKWKRVKAEERKKYLTNAYRVLLTRARQGMVIVVPEGDRNDPTRSASYYDPTFNYLQKVGFELL
ncbi:MAG TPA: DNA/RNA helicase domain-containing protein, partial [Planctomycetota bacterium]|nr:DNA/RNA helicase domain-containing protein [Planctomycetota bacterium]